MIRRTLVALTVAATLILGLVAAPATAQAAGVTTRAVRVLPAAAKDKHSTAGAVAAAKRWFKYWNVDDWEGQYNRLVFEQQALVTLDRFTEWRDSDVYPIVKWVKTVRTKKFKADPVPGTGAKLAGIKVTAQIKIYGRKTTVPMHWYYEAGRWRWSLAQDAMDELANS
jgi:hypothetical protein